ncbi:MAG: PCMD domain-containing protein [Prevotella sp.]|nr:PCMD domain-containing protein [Prevotella sp.]
MKKLFTLMTAALCTLNVMAAGDGDIVKYGFENYKKEKNNKYYTWYELDVDGSEQGIWGTGNSGYAAAKIISGGAKEGDFPTEVEANGRTGACVKLETKDTYTIFSKKTPIAAGNMFFGSFSLNISNPLASTKFGIPYDKKPLSFSFYYKYQAGAKLQDIDRKEVTGKTDKGNAYAVLYDNVNGSFQADGSNILTNENIIGIANAGELDNADEWTYKNVTFDYTKEVDKDKLAAGGYNLAIVFTASIDGAAFQGAIGSVMYVDDVELVCESDAAPVVAKEFTDNLQVTLDGTPLEPQQASIFVSDKGDGKYTLSLPNFVLGTDADAIAVGTITIEDVEGTETDGVITLSATQTITIKDGDLEGVDGWLGPQLGEVPVTLNAEMTEDKLSAEIDIPFGAMSIKVVFGKENTGVEEPVAKEFTDNLQVTLDGTPLEPQQASIFVSDKGDGKYTLSLPNFVLGTDADAIAVGTITIEDVEGTETDGVITLSATQTITIKDGDLEGVDGWLGPQLGEVPVTLNAEMTEDKLYAEIDIPFGAMSIKVVFGKVNTAITGVSADMQQTTGIYTIGGAKVNAMQSGNVYIIRKADGKTVKVVK